ncbi:MAG TPA: methyltransferase domain-containing protein [Candidatus Angelobacter sp.]|nr:methyltransferase domain-containing protein [Candidatus Angelobacter sp.]
MNYLDQQRYFKQSRMHAASSVVAVALMALVCGLLSTPARVVTVVIFAIVAAALAIGLCYLPDYLHLTVNPRKRSAWAIKVRWRIIAAVLVLGLAIAGNTHARIVAVIAVVWLAGANLVSGALRPRFVAPLLWAGDFALLAVLLLTGSMNLLLAAVLLAATTHFAIVASEDRPYLWAVITISASWIVLWLTWSSRRGNPRAYVAFAGLVLVVGRATAWLVARSREQHAKNVAGALAELEDFTGYPPDRIRCLWETSNQQLAENWQNAALAPDDREKLAAWYRDNSELYLFAISGYNLEYKRIRSNMNALKLAQGKCLDYGAGNGEIILELARRGHPAAYYDVDGVTMRFARRRAEQQKLAVEFFCAKEGLTASARRLSFDTAFSFDVLEHLPDLAGELDFLSSLLAPGGILVFDVPAGSTKAHPMHLDHHVDVFAHMRAKGFTDERGLALRLPFKKEEKFVYRKPSSPGTKI